MLNECTLLSDTAPLTIPPRSTLYRLEPASIDTAERESLGSYFCRLADAHCLSPFQLTDIMGRPGKGQTNNRWSRAAWQKPLFSGPGEDPRLWSTLLESMTSVKGLSRLTMLQLSDVVVLSGLMAKTKRWCPLCLGEDSHKGMPYGRLLWEIGAVMACPTHGVKLVDRCSCSPEQHHKRMQAKYLHHICKHCGADLSTCSHSVQTAEAGELVAAQLISQFLASDCFTFPIQRSGFREFLNTIIDEQFDGKATWLAQAIGVGKANMHEWLNDVRVPSLARLVQIAQVTQCSIEDVLRAKAHNASISSSKAPYTSNSNGRRTNVDRLSVLSQLRGYLTRGEPVSVAEIARCLGVSKRYLYLNFNAIAKELASRRLRVLAEQTKADLRELELRYRTTARGLLVQGIIPGWRQLREALGYYGNPFAPELRNLWRRIRAEEIEISGLHPNGLVNPTHRER
jgi:transcriptional regulator with XRE-family HTH domain